MSTDNLVYLVVVFAIIFVLMRFLSGFKGGG